MASPRPTRLWLGRAGLAALALVLIIARLLPLDTLPPRWAGPDLLLAVLLLWTLRRPRLAPVWLIAGVVLLADFLFQRPPGLMAALTVIATEMLRRRQPRLRAGGFGVEWAAAALAVAGILATAQAVMLIAMIPAPPPGLVASQALATALAYPLAAFAARWLFGIARGPIDTRRISA
ncbi:rod shape-determining protein MreD [Limimaricola cinnabarinus]|jgi:rod shape-determining protein MreD|uniref:Rod shape-determining protein MreD n=1 Tax=Limimaricola cinnabarinus TaxID=1125964 RepID=A0A2G1MEQ6_9RHOB|nr:rod shape-determining protein MreD [Limimaricola cinnabarinus]PHP27211.1 rod shape-determining protein MreD [Limimaricola cinnabarinus]